MKTGNEGQARPDRFRAFGLRRRRTQDDVPAPAVEPVRDDLPRSRALARSNTEPLQISKTEVEDSISDSAARTHPVPHSGSRSSGLSRSSLSDIIDIRREIEESGGDNATMAWTRLL